MNIDNQRLERVLSIGRYGEIRTLDPCHPMTVRYQAAPHTDLFAIVRVFI